MGKFEQYRVVYVGHGQGQTFCEPTTGIMHALDKLDKLRAAGYKAGLEISFVDGAWSRVPNATVEAMVR